MPDIFNPGTQPFSAPPKKTESEPVKTVTRSLNPTNVGILSSFCEYPKNISFQTQHPNEEILLFLRSHFITNIPWIVIFVLLAILPLLFSSLGFSIRQLFTFLTASHVFMLSVFYYLVITTYAFVEFATWYFNVFLTTNERIVDIDYIDILYHNVAETKLSNIEEVHYTKGGFFQALFNYGDLFVQTAAELLNFEAKSVPTPERAASIIGQLIGRKY